MPEVSEFSKYRRRQTHVAELKEGIAKNIMDNRLNFRNWVIPVDLGQLHSSSYPWSQAKSRSADGVESHRKDGGQRDGPNLHLFLGFHRCSSSALPRSIHTTKMESNSFRAIPFLLRSEFAESTHMEIQRTCS